MVAMCLGFVASAAQAGTCAASMTGLASNPDAAYTVQADGTATHIATGLMWKRCSEGQSWSDSTCTGSASFHTWPQALKLASTSRFALHDDWRLPNLKELRSLVEECVLSPAINDTIFPATPSGFIWSGSPWVNDVLDSWVVNFNGGGPGQAKHDNRTFSVSVRLVRNGIPTNLPIPSVSHDIAADFSIASNPNGPWSYGYKTSSAAALQLFDAASTNSVGMVGLEHWYTAGSSSEPHVLHNPTNAAVKFRNTIILGANEMQLHPAPDKLAVVRWTSPVAGTYKVDAAFRGNDVTSTLVTIQKNGTAIFNAAVKGFGLGPTFSGVITVAANDTLEFLVDANVTHQNDSTGLALTIVNTSSLGRIDLPSTAFKRGENVALYVSGSYAYGTDTLMNAPPYGTVANAAEWDFDVLSSGKYELFAEYASLESRPVSISFNGKPVFFNALADTTGGNLPANRRTISQGVIDLSTGANVMRVSRNDVFPHIRGFTLVLVSTATITTVSPTSARLDIPQTFTVTGSKLTPGMGFAIEDCEGVQEVGTGTDKQRQFSCTPRLPGAKNVIVKTAPNGAPLFNSAAPATTGAVPITIDHPARTGDPSSRGIPSVKGVSLWNGNYHHSATDMAVPGKGLPFILSRSYNSYYWDYETERGGVDNYHPWRFNWDLAVRYVGGNTSRLSVAREDGSGDGFYKDAADQKWYAINQGGFSTIRTETPGSGKLTYTTRDGRNYVFENPDQGGKLLAIHDHDHTINDQNILKLDYGSNGKVSTVTDTVGRVFTFTYYGTSNLLKRVTDTATPTPHYVEYTWESDTAPNTGAARDRIKTVRDVRGNTTTYNYTSNNSTTEPRIFLTSITDARNNTAVQLTHTKEAYGNWGVTSLTDAAGKVWGFSYCTEEAGGTTPCGASVTPQTTRLFSTVTAPLAPASFTSYFDAAGRYTGKKDGRGNITQITPKPIASLSAKTYALAGLKDARKTAALEETKYTHTPDGNLQSQTNPDGGVRKSDWLAGGAPNCYNLMRSESPMGATKGVVRTMSYDSTCKRLTNQVASLRASVNTYDPTTKLLNKTTDPELTATDFTYYAQGNLKTTTTTDPNNAANKLTTTIDSYDYWGRLTQKTSPGGLVTTYEYDEAGNLVTETVDPAGLNLISRYGYDKNGNQTTRTDPRGYTTTTVYDPANRVQTVTGTIGKGTPEVTATATNAYDELGRLKSVTNDNQHTSATTFDEAGNVKTRSDALPRTTEYTYYPDNRPWTVKDPEGRVTTYEYGFDTSIPGRYTRVSTKNADGSGTFTVTSYIDADGRLVKTVDRKGLVTSYGYDNAGRKVSVAEPANPDIKTTRLGYDNAGRNTSVTDPNGYTTTYGYDYLGRRTSIKDPKNREWTTTYDAAGNVYVTRDPAGKTATRSYDKANRLTDIAWSDGSRVHYTLDNNGNREQMDEYASPTAAAVITRYSYDGLSRVTSITNPNGQTVGYGYDGVGNLKTLTYPGSKTVTYGYDVAERMVSVADWANPAPRTTTYTLDRSDRVTDVSLGNGSTSTLRYDQAGRLASLSNSKGASVINAHTLTRDANGNITQDSNVLPLRPSIAAITLNRTYDTDNRQIGISHDAAGRVTNNGAFTLGWNDREQVISINGEAQAYNTDGVRTSQTAGGATTRFVTDTNASLPNLLLEADASNNPQRYYIHSSYGLVEQIDAATGNPRFYHFDASGNTVALTDASGTVTDKYAYTPFGETTKQGSTPNPFRFVGQYGVRNFNDTPLHDMRARWYAADQARFLSLDPLLGKADEPQTLNRYAYVTGNPVMGVDPSGLWGEQWWSDVSSFYGPIAKRAGETTARFIETGDDFLRTMEPTNPIASMAHESIIKTGINLGDFVSYLFSEKSMDGGIDATLNGISAGLGMTPIGIGLNALKGFVKGNVNVIIDHTHLYNENNKAKTNVSSFLDFYFIFINPKAGSEEIKGIRGLISSSKTFKEALGWMKIGAKQMIVDDVDIFDKLNTTYESFFGDKGLFVGY